MFPDITSFIDELDRRKDLSRITDPVSPDLEISAVIDRVSKSPGGGPALVFEKPTGHSMPVAANLFGSNERVCLALGVNTLDDLAHDIEELTTPPMPKGFMDAIKMLPLANRLTDLMPKTVKDAPCQEVVRMDGGLDELPILRTWPEDGGPFITLPLVFTRDPETGMRNIGTYRMQVFDRRTTGMHWQRHKGGAQHHRIAERMGKRLEVAVALGADPVLTYCATAPMPEGLDELMLAGVIGKRRVEVVKCQTVDLEVPANAQIILEGYVDPGERRREGPFGDHTGFYSLARDYPVFHLTAVTRRTRPIYPTTIVGRPPQEDYWLGKATERLFLPIIRLMLPEVVDMNMPAEGVFHNLVIVSIKKRYPGQARKVMYALWGLGLMMLAKNILVVSEHVDVQNLSEVAWRGTGNVDARRDIVIVDGPMDDLDHAALRHRFGGKMGIDATEKTADDAISQPWPEEIVMSEEIRALVTKRWQEYGL